MINNIKNRLYLLNEEKHAGAIILFLITLTVLMASNGNYFFQNAYDSILHAELHMPSWFSSIIGQTISIHIVVNEVLMSVFFYVIGREVKKELLDKNINEAALPIAAAAGGMLIPALLYYVTVNMLGGDRALIMSSGAGIATATDIPFAIAALGLLGRNLIPKQVSAFLLILAVADDLGGIVIVTIFYTTNLAVMPLIIAIVISMVLFTISYIKVTLKIKTYLYIALSIGLWLALYNSGVHATLSGVIVALIIPLKKRGRKKSIEVLPLWVAYLIIPLFVFLNAGIDFSNENILNVAFEPVAMGIIIGLVIGKPLGIVLASFLYVKLTKVEYLNFDNHNGIFDILAVGFFSGIGFTMATFMANLGFSNEPYMLVQAKTGILVGSFISVLLGGSLVYILYVAKSHQQYAHVNSIFVRSS